MTSPTTVRLVGLLVIVGVSATCGFGEAATAGEALDPVHEAQTRIAALKRALRPRVVNEVILARLAEAQAGVDVLKPPPKPDLVPVDPQAGESQQEEVVKENEQRLGRWTREYKTYKRHEERLRTKWVAALGEALAAYEADPQTKVNIRLEVNERALELLVATGRPDASVVVARALHEALRAGPRLKSSLVLVGSLVEALESLRSLEALELLRQLLSSRDRLLRLNTRLYSPPGGGGGPPPPPNRGTVEYDAQAKFLRVIASYENVPGHVRYLLVRDLLATYEPMEAAIVHDSSAYEMWSKISEAAVDATWRHAGMPANQTGVPLATMHELGAWFAANRSRSGPAWRD